MNSGRAQHITPVFHLKQFVGAQPNGCVWVYNGKADRFWPSSPAGIGHEGWAYSFKRADGTWDTTLDDWITQLEGPGVDAYRKLLEGEIPSNGSEDKRAFAAYLALFHCRSMAMRRQAAELYAGIIALQNKLTAAHAEAFKAALGIIETKEGKPLSEEDREAFRQALLDPADFELFVSKRETFAAFAGVPGLTTVFSAMDWSLCEPLKGFFITSDNPLTSYADPQSPPHLGFRNKTIEIYFPLAPRLLLMLTWRPDAPRRGGLPDAAVQGVNARTAYNAEQFIYSHLKHKHVRKLAKKAAELAHFKTMKNDRVPQFAAVKIKR